MRDGTLWAGAEDSGILGLMLSVSNRRISRVARRALSSFAVATLAALAAAGCGLDRAPLVGEGVDASRPDASGFDASLPDGAVLDAAIDDAGPTDGGPTDGGPVDACVPAVETCDGADDDCDGRVDETFTLATDLTNCGACGVMCTAGAHGAATCAGGVCGIACDPGFSDCDRDAANGCEAALDAATSCGACGTACAGATPVCDASGGAARCVSGCPAGSERCGSSCVDLATSTSNCGSCGSVCADRAHSAGRCEAGACAYTCDAGFADCNMVAADGCETPLGTISDCATCGGACLAVHGVPICTASTCGLGACDPGFGNCDGVTSTGCEAPLSTLSNCGACGVSCDRANATATCGTGSCAIASCNAGFGDCDGADATGCEAPLDTLANCGSCGAACSRANAAASCGTGTCALGACSAGFGNCDANEANGCETSLATSMNCGTCGTTCSRTNAAASCSTGTCTLGACNAGFGDCDMNEANGCETPTTTTTNCGACGVSCTAGQACMGGACVASPSVDQVGAGTTFACARISDGRVYCWGAGGAGRLGNGGTSASSSPVRVLTYADGTGAASATTPLTDAVDIAVGGAHACAVRATGQVVCWGDNQRGQVGGGGATGSFNAGILGVRRTSLGSMTNLPITDAQRVTAGATHTCVLRTGGVVTCWGRDNSGQLGDGSQGGDRGWGVDVTGLTATQIDAGFEHTCAVRTDGTIQCWGLNGNGQLGDGSTSNTDSPVDVSSLASMVQVSAGDAFTCARRSTGSIWCWGLNSDRQLGDYTTSQRNVPVFASALAGPTLTELSAGGTHACARTSTGTVVCWGNGMAGRLGGMPVASGGYAIVTGVAGAVSVGAGSDASCAALGMAGARCWGGNANGQLGDGTTMMRTGSVAVTGLPPAP